MPWRAETVLAAEASEVPRLWADITLRIAGLLHAKVDGNFHSALDSAAAALAVLIDRDPDLAIVQVVRFDDANPGHYSSRRAVHAAIAAQLAARRLGWDAGACNTLLRAALTMHLAMVELQDRLATQSSPLTELQRQAIRSHPQRSAELLRVGGVTRNDWLEAVACHHDRSEGGDDISHGLGDVRQQALMLNRVDDFTAKFAARSMRPALTADRAVRQFQAARPTDPLTAAIVAEFGVYPPGCAVRLQSGEIAVVMRRGVTATTPLVVAVRARNGDALPEPLRRDTGRLEHAVSAVVSAAAVRVKVPLEKLAVACDG